MDNTEKFRILYIGLVPPSIGGRIACGAAVHGWELARSAVDNGYEVYFVADILEKHRRIIKDGVTIIKMPVNKIKKAMLGLIVYFLKRKNWRLIDVFSYNEKVAILARYFFLKKVIKNVRPHLIHIHGENTWSLSMKMLKNSIPIIISNHGHLKRIEREADIARMKRVIQSADGLIFVSKYLKKEEINIINEYSGKKHFINNPTDIEKIPLLDKAEVKKALNICGEKKVILFSGICNTLRLKGLDLLLEAVNSNEKLKKTSQTIILSDDEGIEYAKNFVTENRLDCLIMGPQPWPKIVWLYNSADVFVLPSRSEAFPLVFLESLLAGVPIVGYADAVEEIGRSIGSYVGEKFDAEKESTAHLADKILRALKRNTDRVLMRNKIIEGFSWKQKFCEYDRVYKSAIYETPKAVRPKTTHLDCS